MKQIKLSQKALNKVCSVIKKGGVVICPTDTVYGFLADAANKQAVEEIFKIKKRPKAKPLAVFVKDFKMAKELAEINTDQEKILKKYWPGKYTFILKIKSEARNPKPASTAKRGESETNSNFKFQISNFVTKNGKIALRVPNHEFLLKLLEEVDRPLAQTSVNISGQPPLTKIDDILKFCEKCGRPDLPQLIIDGGNLPKIKPSAIIDLTKDKIKFLRK